MFSVLAAAVLALVLVHEVSGLNRLRIQPVTGTDYNPVAQYVAARHKPGEPVLVALPPPAYLALGSRDDLIFVSSPPDRPRAQRYTRLTADGRYVDYWTGVTSIVSTAELCETILTSPNLWLIVDDARLWADWAYVGPMADVMTGLTYEQYRSPSGSVVRRLAPTPSRNPRIERLCAQEMEKAHHAAGTNPPSP